MVTVTKHKIVWVLILISAGIAGIVYFAVSDTIMPYQFTEIERTYFKENIGRAHAQYHDFDHGGKYELVQSTSPYEGFDYVSVYRSDGTFINQYNITGRFPASYEFYYYDINRDSSDELILLHIADSSRLLLSAVDIAADSFLIKDSPMLEKTAAAKEEVNWDLNAGKHQFIDIDGDEQEEFLFIVTAGYAISPRGIYEYDFSKKKIAASFELGTQPIGFEIADINKNRHPEIILCTSASGNMDEKKGYHDFASWFIVLDSTLQVINNPVELGGYTSKAWCWKWRGDFFMFYEPARTLDPKTLTLYRVTPQLTLEEVRQFPDAIGAKVLSNRDQLKISLFSIKTGIMEIVDSNFSVVAKRDISTVGIVNLCDLDVNLDGTQEYLLTSKSGIYLFDHDLKTIGFTQLPDDIPVHGEDFISGAYENSDSVLICETGSKGVYLFSLKKNPQFWAAAIMPIAAGIGAFLVLYVISTGLFYFFIFFSYFIHSFRKSNTGLIIVNYQGKILYFNQQAAENLHLTEPLKKKVVFQAALRERSEIVDVITEAVQKADKITEPFYYSTPQYQINGAVTATPLLFFKKFPAGCLIELENYTEAILLERTKIWAKSVLKLAHEIKTPLSSISMAMQTIKNSIAVKLPDDTELAGDIETIGSEVTRVRNMTKNFLKFINMEVINFQAVSIEEIANETIQKFTSFINEHFTIRTEFDKKADLIWADPFQLSQVFQIFTENAIDAVQGSGCLLIRTAVVSDGCGGENVEIHFTDNGMGIKEEIKNKLFSPYLTTKREGTGIGLFIAKKIIEDQHGSIRFESKIQKGTTFTITMKVISREELSHVRS